MTQDQALALLKTGANVFLTGEPGSGKTHTVNRYVDYLRAHDIYPAITASTGIAATHINGMTIHSWSGAWTSEIFTARDIAAIASYKHIAKRIKATSVLIIDEISMLDGNIFAAVDAVCRKVRGTNQPFGGLQVVCVGDFFQLPPVVRFGQAAQFVFASNAWKECEFRVCYLHEQYRQDDEQFLDILSAIRSNALESVHVEYLQKRMASQLTIPEGVTKLFTHNADVTSVNAVALARIPGKPVAFQMLSRGPRNFVEHLKKGCLSPEALELKIGAVVMFTKNNPAADFVNGTMGEVTGFDQDKGYPVVRTRQGVSIIAEPMSWVIEDNGVIRANIEQVPLRLAWAITVHKSQGMSLDAAFMDLRSAFEFGQGYVALSRVRRLSGLYLMGFNANAFRVHPDVLAHDSRFRVASEVAVAGLAALLSGELKQRFEDFIVRCGGVVGGAVGLQRRAKVRGGKISTFEVTLALLKSGTTIAAVAATRGITVGTVASHVEQLLFKNKLTRGELMPLIDPSLVEALPTIHALFREVPEDSSLRGKLKPVFDKLQGKYSYDDLRLARLLLA